MYEIWVGNVLYEMWCSAYKCIYVRLYTGGGNKFLCKDNKISTHSAIAFLNWWLNVSKLDVKASSAVSSQVKSMNSSSSSTCANESTCWDRAGEADICSVVDLPVTTPENLYLMGKETFTPRCVCYKVNGPPEKCVEITFFCLFAACRYGFIWGGSKAVGGSVDIQEQAGWRRCQLRVRQNRSWRRHRWTEHGGEHTETRLKKGGVMPALVRREVKWGSQTVLLCLDTYLLL